VSGRDPVEDYRVINRELANYDRDLAERPQIIVATKIDALDEPDRLEKLRKQAKTDRKPLLEISSATNVGIRELVNAVAIRLQAEAPASTEAH
jgi:GTP-binding protein